MFILNFLIWLFIAILVIVVFSTIIKFSMFCIMRYNYNSNIIVIPAIANILSCLLVFIGWYLVVTKLLHIDFANIIFNMFITKNMELQNFMPTLLITIGFIIIGILLQAFSYMLINISYKDSFGKVRMNIKEIYRKVLKKEEKIDSLKENTISEFQDIPRVSFINALIGSIFSFSLTFFITGVLFFIGSVISSRFI